MNTQNIGFIGGGNMASSLIKGLITSGHSPKNIWVTDVNQQVLENLATTLKIHVVTDHQRIIEAVDVVVLAVKPQIIRKVTEKIAPLLSQKKLLVVSIAAGINQRHLMQWIGGEVAIVRCMPNMPALVLTGATALHANANVSQQQKDLAENILRAVGICLWVNDENDLDTVTAVSGSGPAYYFLLMQAMEEAAQALGLEPKIARLLIQQTALGAAKVALELASSPEQLRQQVSSPGGTTERAIKVFEQGDFTSLVLKALQAAKKRSIELSAELGGS
jgi:pyrroline-5-carboxylate reductase